MRHREAVQQRLVALHIDQQTAICAVVSPTIGDIGIRYARHVSWASVLKRKPIEMTAVLRGEFADEWWSPQRAEAIAITDRCDAAKLSVHEHRPAISKNCNVVGVHVAGNPGLVRGIDRV